MLSSLILSAPASSDEALSFSDWVGAGSAVLTLVTVIIAVIVFWRETRASATAQASKIAVWAVIPHNKQDASNIRGVVIANSSEQVVRELSVRVRAGDESTHADTYPVVPPGVHFLPLQTRGAEDDAQWPSGEGRDAPRYWLLPVKNGDGNLTIDLRDGGKNDLRAWAETESARFELEELRFDLGNKAWKRTGDGPVVHERWARKSVEVPAGALPVAKRVFPDAALTDAEIVAQDRAEHVQQSYEESFTLIDELSKKLAGKMLSPSEERTQLSADLQKAGIVKVARSKSLNRGDVKRGGLSLQFFLEGEEKPERAYSFGLGQTGRVEWFVREKGSWGPERVFTQHPTLKTSRKVEDWTGRVAELSTFIIETIAKDTREGAH